MKTIIRLCLFGTLLLSYQNCSQVDFAPQSETAFASKNGTFDEQGNLIPPCRVSTSEVVKTTKVLFVVDASGSNTSTDPKKNFRHGAIKNFIDEYQVKPNFKWQFMTFQKTEAVSYVMDGSQNPKFADQASDIQQALTTFLSSKDSGTTPYRLAFDEIKRNITSDPDYYLADRPNYAILFMSDGKPSDMCENYDPNKNCSPTNLDLWMQKVDALIQLDPTHITISTVYYGPEDSEASDNLKQMAIYGNGQFVDTNKSGQNIKMSDVITVPGGECQQDTSKN